MSHTNFNGSQTSNMPNNTGYINTPSILENDNISPESRQQKCLLPVMINQILNATIPDGDDPFKIDNKETSNITLVASIKKVNIESITTTITIKDSTGEMDVKIWESDEKTNQTNPNLLKLSILKYRKCDLLFVFII